MSPASGPGPSLDYFSCWGSLGFKGSREALGMAWCVGDLGRWARGIPSSHPCWVSLKGGQGLC